MAIAELSSLLLSLYQGSQEMHVAQFQDFASDLVKPILPFNSSIWGSGAITNSGFRHDTIHLHNEPTEVLAAYADVKDQDRAVKVLKNQQGGALSYTARDFFRGRDCSGIREYTRRFAHENTTICSVIDTQAAFVRWISFYRADALKEFSEHEIRLAEALIPHLFEALSISRRCHLRTLMSATRSQKWLFAISDKEGFFQHMEKEFRELLEEELS